MAKTAQQTRSARSAKAAQIRAAQEAKARRVRNLTVAGVVVAVLAIVVGVAYGVQSARDTSGQSSTRPANLSSDYTMTIGEPNAPVEVTIYADFQCPACAKFEAEQGDALATFVEAGDVRVNYRMMSFLNDASTTDYSTRAMNAFAVVLEEHGTEAAAEFHDLLFAQQPAEGTAGLSDDELVDLAVEAGATEDAVRPGIEDLQFEQWIVNATDQASRDGVSSTPTTLVNGQEVDPYGLDSEISTALASSND
ncbi:MAG TPA: thioredoxin domain-containing protein [Intrasporangium sp.]|nr:thioredoxin domain-containing protein [Intrasporangium sp.]